MPVMIGAAPQEAGTISTVEVAVNVGVGDAVAVRVEDRVAVVVDVTLLLGVGDAVGLSVVVLE